MSVEKSNPLSAGLAVDDYPGNVADTSLSDEASCYCAATDTLSGWNDVVSLLANELAVASREAIHKQGWKFSGSINFIGSKNH